MEKSIKVKGNKTGAKVAAINSKVPAICDNLMLSDTLTIRGIEILKEWYFDIVNKPEFICDTAIIYDYQAGLHTYNKAGKLVSGGNWLPDGKKNILDLKDTFKLTMDFVKGATIQDRKIICLPGAADCMAEMWQDAPFNEKLITDVFYITMFHLPLSKKETIPTGELCLFSEMLRAFLLIYQGAKDAEKNMLKNNQNKITDTLKRFNKSLSYTSLDIPVIITTKESTGLYDIDFSLSTPAELVCECLEYNGTKPKFSNCSILVSDILSIQELD